MAAGKWNHMMDQTHIGYTYWQQPPVDKIPDLITCEVPNEARMGIAVEGNPPARLDEQDPVVLPELSALTPDATHYVEIFNSGATPFTCQIETAAEYLHISPKNAKVQTQARAEIGVDWGKAPYGRTRLPLQVTASNGQKITFYADIYRPDMSKMVDYHGFMENDGYVSMHAENYTRAVESDRIHWKLLPDLGRVASAVTFYPTIKH